jgi:hypothetical protein
LKISIKNADDQYGALTTYKGSTITKMLFSWYWSSVIWALGSRLVGYSRKGKSLSSLTDHAILEPSPRLLSKLKRRNILETFRPGRLLYVCFVSVFAVAYWGFPILILIFLLLSDTKEKNKKEN